MIKNELFFLPLFFFSALIIWQFVGYALFMVCISKFINREDKDYSYQPFISILVATYNEEVVIRRRIENLLDLYYSSNQYEILVIDSGSIDKTRQIVKAVIKEHSKVTPQITLVEEEIRRGKSSALNLGIRHAKGDIILVADANSIYNKNVLRELAPYFKNPEVGAISGRYMVQNSDKGIPEQENFYWKLENTIFRAESALDSVSTVIGTISAWRKQILNFSSETITEDLDMSLTIRRKGYKILYEPNAIAYENAAITINDQILQRRRTALGTLQATIRHIQYFIPPKDFYSAIIFPSHKILVMFSPLLLISIPVLYLIIWDPFIIFVHFISTGFLFTILFSILFNITTLPVEGNADKFSIHSLTSLIHYVLLNEYIILLAWKDLIAGNHSVLWEKAVSTRKEG